MIVLYTDGSALIADQSGGWAWWIDDRRYDSGYVCPATNNTMEVTAVIQGLLTCRQHRPDEDVLVVSDSMYVIGCFTQQWYKGWRRRAVGGKWKTSQGKPVANQALWERLVDLVETYPSEVRWRHCHGHKRGGAEDAPYVAGNARVDALAGRARKAGPPTDPEGTFRHTTEGG